LCFSTRNEVLDYEYHQRGSDHRAVKREAEEDWER
jgi:hypothetical protein